MTEKIIFHIDVNSAFLSWSAQKLLRNGGNVDLREIPSIVGGDMERRHGVVLAKSVPAKKYGVKTGEPIVNALRKCPSLLIEPPDHGLYHQRSRELMDYLSELCPEIEQLSVDECFMDFSPIRKDFPSPEDAALSIKNRIREHFGFTVNIGISDKKVLAKMASDFEKPDKVHTLYSWQIQEKMWPLPVSALYMCGKSSVEALRKLEIKTIGDLAQTDQNIIFSHLKSHGLLLWEYANGIDDSAVSSVPPEAKGIGNSTTLSRDVTDSAEAFHFLLALSDSVAMRLRKADMQAGMVSVEIKYSNFQTVSHQMLLSPPSNISQVIYDTACRLFTELWNGSPIRLLGIRTSKLTDGSFPTQLSLFDLMGEGVSADISASAPLGTATDLSCKAPTAAAPDDSPSRARASISQSLSPDTRTPSREKMAALDKTLDAIRDKYGKTAVVRGSFLKKS